jgi:hypothetical protein
MKKFIHIESLKFFRKLFSERTEESKITQLLDLIRLEMLQHHSEKSEQNYGKTSRPT